MHTARTIIQFNIARQRKTPTRSAYQYGGRVLVFRSRPLQRGHGLGGLFKTLFRVAVPVIRRAAPIAKRVAKTIGKEAVERAKKTGAKDVISNRSTLKEALKERAQEAALTAAMDAINKSATPKRQTLLSDDRRESNKSVHDSKHG